jgi:hypothetical protein
MKRICFGWHADTTRFSLTGPVPLAIGMPPSNRVGVDDLRRSFRLTANKGFMVVGEATARLFECDPEASTVLDLRRYAHLPEGAARLAADLNRHFDVLVLGLAYEINPSSRYDRLADLLERVEIPIVALDLSVAEETLSPPDLDPSVMRLVRLLSERATLFGVRALSTQRWLERHGVGGGVPVGCPSLYLYPDAILGMEPAQISLRHARLATGGYIFRKPERARRLATLFAGTRTDYILQDEIFSLDDAQLQRLRYVDARREFDARDVNRLAEREFGYRLPFERYFFFDDMSSWRQNLVWHDAYVGDRFHGAVVAMQAGRPTVVICRDVRSEELAAFYEMPALSLDEALVLGLERVLEERLAAGSVERMKAAFARRLAQFEAQIETCGLKLNLPTALASSHEISLAARV